MPVTFHRIVLIGNLDTKSTQYPYLRESLNEDLRCLVCCSHCIYDWMDE